MINLEQTIIEARQYCFAYNLTQKQYLHKAGIPNHNTAFLPYTGMCLGSFICFIRPLGKMLFVDGLAVTTLEQAKAPINARVRHLTFKGRGLRLGTAPSVVRNFLQTSADTQLKVYLRYCQKLNLKIEVR